MRLLKACLFAGVALLTMGSKCSITPVPMPIEPHDTAMCASACDHLRMLGCPEGESLEDGTTCETFCLNTQKSGHALRPSCVVNIKTCAELDAKCANAPRQVFE